MIQGIIISTQTKPPTTTSQVEFEYCHAFSIILTSYGASSVLIELLYDSHQLSLYLGNPSPHYKRCRQPGCTISIVLACW